MGKGAGHGNRLYNFTGLVVTYPTDFSPDAERIIHPISMMRFLFLSILMNYMI